MPDGLIMQNYLIQCTNIHLHPQQKNPVVSKLFIFETNSCFLILLFG